jgi:hypothetical protein
MSPINLLQAIKLHLPQLQELLLKCDNNPALEKLIQIMFPDLAPFIVQIKAILPYAEYLDDLIPYINFLEQLLSALGLS